MIILLSIYRNIKDVEEVLRFYIDDIFPSLHRFPGVIGTDLHSVSEISPEFPQGLEGVELVIETYFESYHSFLAILDSPIGKEIMRKMGEADIGDYYIYWTKVKRFRSETYLSTKLDINSTFNVGDVIQSLKSAENLASLELKGEEQQGAFKVLDQLRTELNFLERGKTNIISEDESCE